MRVALSPIETGTLVRLADERGRSGTGECAPLPGYSPDTLDACRAAIEGVDWGSVPALADGDALAWIAAVGARVPATLPAARHALESAALDLAAHDRGVAAWRILTDRASSLGLAALLDRDDPLASAERAFARGIRTLKLKLGSDFPRELAQARALRDRFGRDVALRFDANQAWSVAEARAHLAALAPLDPEFVEEPTADLAALGASPVPLARDESLQPPGAAVEGPGVAVVVLKPMALGGITRCIALATRARARGLDVVVTHLRDGAVALARAAVLAFAVGTPSRAMGLDRFATGPARIDP